MIFHEFLKTWKSYVPAVDLCRWSQDQQVQSRDVDSGMCDLRLDLSHLFYMYFCKFCFIKSMQNAPLWHALWSNKLNLQWCNKWDESSLKSHVPEPTSQLIPNLGKTGANGRPKWWQIWMFSNILKKLHFTQIEFFFRWSWLQWVIYRIRWQNKKKMTLWAL